MFRAPRCPYRHCSQHRRPAPDFCIRFGTYHPKCRPRPVPRFRCRSCRRTFSRQTFRADFRDHRPHLNALLFAQVAQGCGIRQTSRLLGLSLRCTELKLRKIARHLRRLNLNLRAPLRGGVSFHLDEFETFEGQRNTRPLSVPMLIESGSRYIVWAESATIRPRGRMTEKRRKAIESAERRHGPRKDNSRRGLVRTLRRGAQLLEPGAPVAVFTDEKSSYPSLVLEELGGRPLAHLRTNSQEVRDTENPLFPINHEEAMARYLMGRLRRESWLHSKKRRYLDLALHLHMAWRNLVGKRFNRDEESPAQVLGLVPRRLGWGECLSWRQDWGRSSIHPVARRGESVWRWEARRARAA